MRVAFVNPPFRTEFGRFSREQRSPAITKGGTLYYPMWLCAAAGLVEARGFEVMIVDGPARRLELEAIEGQLRRFAPRLIVVDTSTPSIESDVAAAAQLQAATGALAVLVGPHPSALPEETLALSTAVQAVARQEYEHTILELAELLRDRDAAPSANELGRIAGLSFRAGDEIHHNQARELCDDLDSLPFLSQIYRRHLNVRDYFYTICQYPQVAIFTGRGCPFPCEFCVYPQVMTGKRFRKRSVENVIAELRFIERELPEVREVFIEDDTFTMDGKRVRAFCDGYARAGLSISWVANSRADVDITTLQAMKRANCRLLCVGFESGSQQLLDAMGKRLSLEQARQFMRDSRRAGVLVHGCFMVGNPGEDAATMRQTLEYALELMPDTAQFFPIMVYPGTKAYDRAKEQGHLHARDFGQWLTPQGSHNCVVGLPDLSSSALVEFCDHARRVFYLRPRYLAYRAVRLLRHPREDGPRMLKSAAKFWRFLLRGTDRSASPR